MGQEQSRYQVGGFEPRFCVRRTDGKPCRPSARYIVLDGSGSDRHAVKAILCYADSVEEENSQLASDLRRMVTEGWPISLAQHENAQ